MTWDFTRTDESRRMMWHAMTWACSMYTEQEGKKDDHWRDVPLPQLFDHLKHEFDEVERNFRRNEPGFLLHNAGDLQSLFGLFLARTMELNGIEPWKHAET